MRKFTDSEKRFTGTAILIVFCLTFFTFFEQVDSLSSFIQGFIIVAIFFFVLPIAYCRLVLDEPLKNLGIQVTSHIQGILWAVLASFGGFFIVWALQMQFPKIAEETLFPVLVETHFGWFVLYALVCIPLTQVVYEVFFRGMLQYLWLGNTWLAFGIQALFFAFLVLAGKAVNFGDIPFLMTALLSGLVMKKTSSLWYAWLASTSFMFMTDVLFLSLR